MLVYETEGFLEVESKDIQQLCRSTAAVCLGGSAHESSAVHAIICNYLDNSTPRCQVAFCSKPLKRAFIFSVKGSEDQPPWQNALDTLTQLGFQLEEVNLNLSAAMLEVVLRDVPGLLSPDIARKQRAEKASLLAEFQSAYDEAPDSVQGKKAALKLNAEKRMNEQAEELRQLLEAMLTSQKEVSAKIDVLDAQLKELASRLETAEALAASERKQREMSESITAAAEKRIQELEDDLVDAETQLSKTLKQTQKNTQLQKRVKQLEDELKAAVDEQERQRERYEQVMLERNAAHEQISLLENQHKEVSASLEKVEATLVKEQVESSRLCETLKEAELRAETLRSELEGTEKDASRHAETEKKLTSVQAQLRDAQQELKKTLDLGADLEQKLVDAIEQNAASKEHLRVAEKNARDKNQVEEQLLALKGENKQLTSENKELREECSQQRSIRKRLEKGAQGEDKRIQELEEALARKIATSGQVTDIQERTEENQEAVSLRAELEEMKQRIKVEQHARQELESEVDEAHKLIDSLEKMLRETEGPNRVQRSHEASDKHDRQKVRELEEKLKTLEEQIERELAEQKRLAKAVCDAEKKIKEQAEVLRQEQKKPVARGPLETEALEPAPKRQEKPAKPLPHEVRPAPKKGALFHPDWDLEGLPCKSSKEVFKVWEAAFNVQTSLEGYPSQYCMAFLVVLQVNQQKKVYLLYYLKQNKHTLVCVPAKTPQDENSLKKIIQEGLHFLKMSGFEMDEMKNENIDNTLKKYFFGG